jgi:DNA repair protein RecO (recombination protein O)
LKTLARAEWRGGLPLLTGAALLCGFYLNELVLKLLAKEDAHPALFDDYALALESLAQPSPPAAQAVVLRRFELRLLAELGYALALTHDVDSGAPIEASRMYHYVPDRGAYLLPPNVAREPGAYRGLVVRGATLIALSASAFDAESAAEAKRLMREVLDHHLEERRIVSRRVVRDLMALEDEKERQ